MKKFYLTNDQLEKLNTFLENSKIKGVDVDFFQTMRNMFNNGQNEFELNQSDIKKLIAILNTTLLKGYDAKMFVSIQDSLLLNYNGNRNMSNPAAVHDEQQQDQSKKETKPGLYENSTPKNRSSPKSFSDVLDKLKNESNNNGYNTNDPEEDETDPEILEEKTEEDDTEAEILEDKKVESNTTVKKESVNIPFNTDHADPSNDNAVDGFFSSGVRDDSNYL